jgi:purine-nucleoside phosphorylase
VQGHKGALVLGLGDKKVVAMQGRFHFMRLFNGRSDFPVRMYLGVTKLIVSNASGGVNPTIKWVIL